ncbi:MAG TPA: 23S rRNA (guanosine(2251)-2'-O)-methyltransferase RlmB [Ignavibacteria bacterium]|nr:23S rRNA (guanosine(2251)-2'-O)-methyltransferase RlmB [Ignavibacteria bacterium]
MIVIGKNPVLEMLETNPKEINKVVLLKSLKPEPKLLKIKELAEKNRINTLMLKGFEFEKFFDRKNKSEGITQGVICFIKDFEYTSLSEIFENTKKVQNPLLVLLDEITDPHNMGAVIRSAVCLGADGIVIPRHNSAEVNHTVIKTSSGAVNYLPIAKETNLVNSITYLKNNGFWIIGTDMQAKKFTYEMDFKRPIALVLGSEGKGIRKIIKDNCDDFVRIPMTGKLDSLNVSVSAGVVMYEILRQKNV